MTTNKKYNDPALREALRLEQSAKPHFLLADGWQDAVLKQAKSTLRWKVWTAAAAIVVLLIGTAAILWQQKAKDRCQQPDILHQETKVSKVDPPIVIAQSAPKLSESYSSTEKSKQAQKRSRRISRRSLVNSIEVIDTPTPTSLSANRDRMRQAMFKKMDKHSYMTELEPEEIDEI